MRCLSFQHYPCSIHLMEWHQHLPEDNALRQRIHILATKKMEYQIRAIITALHYPAFGHTRKVVQTWTIHTYCICGQLLIHQEVNQEQFVMELTRSRTGTSSILSAELQMRLQLQQNEATQALPAWAFNSQSEFTSTFVQAQNIYAKLHIQKHSRASHTEKTENHMELQDGSSEGALFQVRRNRRWGPESVILLLIVLFLAYNFSSNRLHI